MPRRAREKSSTGIYHVMLRGINGQTIFVDNEDHEKMILTLENYKEVCGFELYAYCLMSNHIHLLIKEGSEDLGFVFRRIGASYVHWYNRKYRRTGHLFQDRYKSEAVEDDKYLLTVLRYIHQNPIKAGIVKDIGKYAWSSYNEYTNSNRLCNTRLVLSYFANEEKKALQLFKSFNQETNKDNCLDYGEMLSPSDVEAAAIIAEVAGIEKIIEIQNFDKSKRDNIIKELKNRGISIRQIERLTGVSFGTIRSI